MSPELANYIVKGLVGLCTALITTYLVPAIAKWVASNNNSALKKFIDSAVDAAEQVYGPKTASQKKEYVVTFIKTKCKRLLKKLHITDETLDMLIEASVSRVSATIKQAKEVAAVTYSATAINNSTTSTETQNGLIVAKQESAIYKSAGDNTNILQ